MSLQEQNTAKADNFTVVSNDEEQFSIWPAHEPLPPGWNEAGKAGGRAECLDYIGEVWTDMRPLSLRKRMAEAAQRQPSAPVTPDPSAPGAASLVERLSSGVSAVKLFAPAADSPEALVETLSGGYVYIEFTHPGGETKLGVRLDASRCELSGADFESGTGSAHLEGELTLDAVKVRCVADIQAQTLTGEGRLEVLAA